ncbi:MAG: hypothetical protein U9Q81_27455 [Pseudomonadota bacterium]|nr:hypothetical protein [Pseudomonadota bacterium]
MNLQRATILATLLGLPLWVPGPAVFASDPPAGQQQEPVPSVGTAADAPTESGESPGPVGDGPAEKQETAGEEQPSPPVSVGEQSEPALEGTKEPVIGAFGVPLGEPFDPCMVAKVISKEEISYEGRDKAELKGTLYRVEAKVPNPHFNEYSLKTTSDGRIYEIVGRFEHPEKATQCKETKRLAEFLIGKYGKPRGKGMLGDWYSFRDFRDFGESKSGPYKGLRLYAPRCRNGRYWIQYSDDGVRTEDSPASSEPTEWSGL